MSIPKRKKKESGQSLIEFILTLFSFMTILFMVVQVSLGFGVANYIQYATFMTARSLLSSGTTEQEQIQRAQGVLRKFVGENGNRFQGIVRAGEEGDPPGGFVGGTPLARGSLGKPAARDQAWEQGATFKFKARLYMLPMVRSRSGTQNFVELESQTWLGREPSEQECQKYVTERKGITIDNGC